MHSRSTEMYAVKKLERAKTAKLSETPTIRTKETLTDITNEVTKFGVSMNHMASNASLARRMRYEMVKSYQLPPVPKDLTSFETSQPKHLSETIDSKGFLRNFTLTNISIDSFNSVWNP